MNGFEFCKKHDLLVDVPYRIWKDIKFDMIDIAFSESYIPTKKSTYCLRISWVLENMDRLLSGRFKREDMKYIRGQSEIESDGINRINEMFNKTTLEDL